MDVLASFVGRDGAAGHCGDVWGRTPRSCTNLRCKLTMFRSFHLQELSSVALRCKVKGRRRNQQRVCAVHRVPPENVTDEDAGYLIAAAALADSSAGLTQPHPNAGCVLVGADGRVLAETFQRAQGTESAELQAVRLVGEGARGCTAYLNLETGDCHGEDASVKALLQAGVSRVVVGLRHPLTHLRGQAILALQRNGVHVEVAGEVPASAAVQEARQACLEVNEALLHKAAKGRPLGVLKYAMTLDGKIATSKGHSAWVSSSASRQRVFEMRARSDAVIVGGETVRRDNPRLTTRREGGHTPARIVMSRTLDLPADANLWDISTAPTIVMTQRGAKKSFQGMLRGRGVEVVEFDFLTPEAVAEYCSERGFLQCLWECGGTLAAPAIAGGAIHKAMAFIAPKMIGGVRAPSPVGELGNVEMTQALDLVDTKWMPSGPDMLLSGYLPASGGLEALEATLAAGRGGRTDLLEVTRASSSGKGPAAVQDPATQLPVGRRVVREKVAEFYKSWDQYGALSNFSPHAVLLPDAPVEAGQTAPSLGTMREWPTVEHFYQSQKFAGVEDDEARELMESIASAPSPEEAARIGRSAQRSRPDLIRPSWDASKLSVMYIAVRDKFTRHTGPREMLLSTAKASGGPLQLVESSPHDFFWGRGVDGSGANQLGHLLTRVRDELGASRGAVPPSVPPQQNGPHVRELAAAGGP
eukprot:jgi/Botrbrau1/10220/Bobra.0362s0010.1